MNKYIYIGFLFFLLGCQKEGVVSFDQEKDCIQFNYDPKEEQMVLEYDFAFQTVAGEDEWGYPTDIYLGDSISRDTISVFLSLMGHASDVDREFKLKTVPLELLEELPLATVEFLPTYTFRANHLLDTVQVILVRPEQRGKYAVGITFDFEDGNCSFVSMKTDDGGDASVLSVVDFNGSKQLKVDVQDCANVPKVNFSINQILASDDFDKVKTIEMEITFESKDGATPIGWAGGAIGTQGGEKSPAWAQTSWECGEYENPVSEVTVIQRKFLLPSEKFVNGTENTDMLLMRWGADVAYNMYVDNIRFLDDSGNEIVAGVW